MKSLTRGASVWVVPVRVEDAGEVPDSGHLRSRSDGRKNCLRRAGRLLPAVFFLGCLALTSNTNITTRTMDFFALFWTTTTYLSI